MLLRRLQVYVSMFMFPPSHPSALRERAYEPGDVILELPQVQKMVKGASAVGKRSPHTRRAGKKHPSRGFACLVQTKVVGSLARGRVSCSLHQLSVAILATRSRPPADPLELFGVPLLIVRTAPEMRPGGPELLLALDHYGCGLGCDHRHVGSS